jgi:hypothetical protein
MSWHWSRLSTLVFLGLLYVSPLSSGDKGLWLSVTSIPVPLFGALPGEMPPEHLILLPDRGGLTLATARLERSEPALDPGLLAAGDTTAHARSEQVGYSSTWSAAEEICPSSSAPRGPPT